jgi:hypothetical protein
VNNVWHETTRTFSSKKKEYPKEKRGLKQSRTIKISETYRGINDCKNG